jgi:trehalose-6-phosphatase
VDSALRGLCRDPHNIVFVLSNLNRSDIEARFGAIQGLGLVANNGFFARHGSRCGYLTIHYTHYTHYTLYTLYSLFSKLTVHYYSLIASLVASFIASSSPHHRLIIASSSPQHRLISTSGKRPQWRCTVPEEEMIDEGWKEVATSIMESFAERTNGARVFMNDCSVVYDYTRAGE